MRQWNTIRKVIVAANQADPDDPEPLILFYRSFIAQGIAPTKNAVQGLVTASDAAPQDKGLRMMVAMQMLKDGKVADARNALRPIAFDPHGGEMGEAAGADPRETGMPAGQGRAGRLLQPPRENKSDEDPEADSSAFLRPLPAQQRACDPARRRSRRASRRRGGRGGRG